MKKTKEKQITSYEQLVRICESFGARYNPGKEAIKPTALSSLLEQAQQSVEAVTVAQQANTSVISARNEAYAGITKLATRIFHAMAAWDASEKHLEDAMQIRRTLEYHPPKRKFKNPDGNGNQAKPEGNPAMHLNFEAQARNFKRLIECVKSVPGYTSNEPDLSIEAMETFYQQLQKLTAQVISTRTSAMQARIKRNELLFGPAGIYGIGSTVKHYVRSAYRHNSEEFLKVSKISLNKK